MFHGADTGLTPEYLDIRERFGTFDLVLLEIGAFHPAWGDIHLGPEHAMEARAMLGSGRLLPIHWGTFNLAMHAWDEPIETLTSLAPSHGVELLTPQIGEPVEPSRVDDVRPWWRTVATAERVSDPDGPPTQGGDDTTAVSWPVD